ncbi:DUF3854 domain-containing protein [Enemella evansiae]|uniref:DUF3854 domain-containing protein n=1 Tax=Enemella evansiae TaxID=2016499 RepID=UPI0015C68D1C|nr:DUF3854 domain-containing protein [Enemella evansiae]
MPENLAADNDRTSSSTEDDEGGVLSDEHAAELSASAIPLQVALDAGVYTAWNVDQLPAWAHWVADCEDSLPALVYPMVHPDGSETGQVKPVWGSVTSSNGRVLKYVSPSKGSNPPQLPVLRAVDDPSVVLIVEGVKQALAALAHAPEDWSIYRITGIWSWMVAGKDGDEAGTPTPHLAVVQGCDVVIVADADAQSNVRVFDGATALGKACTGYGASSVRFARLPGGGKDGLDDLLARLSDDDARRNLLRSWVENAKSRPADLNQRDVARMRSELAAREAERAAEAAASGDTADGRVGIDMDGDPRQTALQLAEALVSGGGGKTVFQLNNRLTRVRRDEGGSLRADELDVAGLHRELLDVSCPFTTNRSGIRPVPVPAHMLGLVADHSDRLPRLTGITRAPVVHTDGTVNTVNGYDPATGLVLDLSENVRHIDVPAHPTDSEIGEASQALRHLFAFDGEGGYDGWVFKDFADQTNAVAALITPFVRALVGPAPMFLVDGLAPGVGKGELINVIHDVAFGTKASFQPAPTSDEEMDKRISAQLLEGATSIVLDEVQDEDDRCRLESASLRAALTSEIYRGRELAKTKMLNLPNGATWFGAGNGVQVPRDMARRVVPIRLDSDRPDLENRGHFRYDLSSWVPENRGRLVRACLLLVRAWYDRGQPEAPRDFGFSSFTEWQRVLGGIVSLAGFDGFLANVMEVRALTDNEAVDNRECWAWMESIFPAGTRFGAGEVLAQAKADPDAPPPYGRSWSDLDARALSLYFGTHRKWYGDLRVRADGKLHGRGKAYIFDRLPSGTTALQTPVPPPAPTPAGSRRAAAAGGEVIEFTDRHGQRERVGRVMPSVDGVTIADLGGDAS